MSSTVIFLLVSFSLSLKDGVEVFSVYRCLHLLFKTNVNTVLHRTQKNCTNF